MKTFDWELEGFVPGKHCTRCRLHGKLTELQEPRDKEFRYICGECLPGVRAWKKRSDTAKRTALKRRKRR